jgi:chorismate-pyruvate lyase
VFAARTCCLVWLLATAACTRDTVAARAARPDDLLARVEALALLQTLNAELLSHDSASLTLERWCDAHGLAAPPRIVAERIIGTDKKPTAQQRVELGVTPLEPVRYRRVRLRCGAVVLSEADNWYVPSRLTDPMNEQLDHTDAAFGKVVQTLNFRRHTLSATLLWSPLPEGWENQPRAASVGAGKLHIPERLLEHRAVLVLPDGTPISEVVETYTGNVLAFPMPRGEP